MSGPILAEWEQVASRFGVAMEQVRRDHLISHVLAAISSGVSSDDLVFFGGTALSRTHLADARLSEDIDLIAQGARGQVAGQIERAVRRGIARSHGRPTWQPTLTATTGSQPAVLSVADGTSVQVQLLGGDGYSWPTEVVDIEQRYSDAPPARLRVLTADAFAAAKLGAWIDRGTPRDLYDLWAMRAGPDRAVCPAGIHRVWTIRHATGCVGVRPGSGRRRVDARAQAPDPSARQRTRGDDCRASGLAARRSVMMSNRTGIAR